MFDFNDAEQSKAGNTLIPEGTIVPVHLSLRPGGAGDGGWLKSNKTGNSTMLDCEFTVIDGPFAKRKFWGYMTVEGETDGQKTAADITRSNIRAMLESARGVEPGDDSEKAVTARKIKGFEDLDGLRFWVAVKIEAGTGGYKDNNRVKYVITPDRKEWEKLDQVTGPSAANPAPVAKAAGSARPSWATSGAKIAPNDANVPF